MTYFGVDETPYHDFGDAGLCVFWSGPFTCPGSGNQDIQELSLSIDRSGQTGNIRLAVYSADGLTCLAQGSDEVALTGTGFSWQGHMNQASVIAYGGSSPGVLVGGVDYLLACTTDGSSGDISPACRIDGERKIKYIAGVTDYTGGFPSALPETPNTDTGIMIIRCGVDPAGGGGLSIPIVMSHNRRMAA